MTFTYGPPGSLRRHALRFLVGDVNQGQVLLQDEEYDYLLALWSNEGDYMVASYCAETIAAKFAREIDFSADSQTVGAGALQEKYLSLALRLRTLAKGAFPGEIYVGGMEPNMDYAQGTLPLSFGTQMHDNPEAGRQDYGDAGDYYRDDWREQWGMGDVG